MAERDAARSQAEAAQSQVATLESDIETLESDIETMQSEVETLQSEIEELMGGALVKTLSDIAADIKSGEIDVGTEDGLVSGQRYHNIHNVVLGLGCTACHKSEMTTLQEVFSAQDVSATAPAPVDRSGCVACHSVGGPATALYGPEP